MSGLTVLFVVLAVVLTVPVYAFAVRRLLGLRLSPLRAWIGGLIALACASPIITAIGSSIAKHNGSWSLLPAVWFVILGVAIALLIGMLVLVIFEALVSSGAMPGPLYLIRAWRKRVRRVRHYSRRYVHQARTDTRDAARLAPGRVHRRAERTGAAAAPPAASPGTALAAPWSTVDSASTSACWPTRATGAP